MALWQLLNLGTGCTIYKWADGAGLSGLEHSMLLRVSCFLGSNIYISNNGSKVLQCCDAI